MLTYLVPATVSPIHGVHFLPWSVSLVTQARLLRCWVVLPLPPNAGIIGIQVLFFFFFFNLPSSLSKKVRLRKVSGMAIATEPVGGRVQILIPRNYVRKAWVPMDLGKISHFSLFWALFFLNWKKKKTPKNKDKPPVLLGEVSRSSLCNQHSA